MTGKDLSLNCFGIFFTDNYSLAIVRRAWKSDSTAVEGNQHMGRQLDDVGKISVRILEHSMGSRNRGWRNRLQRLNLKRFMVVGTLFLGTDSVGRINSVMEMINRRYLIEICHFCLGWCSNFVGSKSGQTQSVKLLQNTVYNTTQHPPTPQPH